MPEDLRKKPVSAAQHLYSDRLCTNGGISGASFPSTGEAKKTVLLKEQYSSLGAHKGSYTFLTDDISCWDLCKNMMIIWYSY